MYDLRNVLKNYSGIQSKQHWSACGSKNWFMCWARQSSRIPMRKKTCQLKNEFIEKINCIKKIMGNDRNTTCRLITHPLCPAGKSRNRGGWRWGTASPAWGHVPSNSCRNSNWPTSPPQASQTASASLVQPLWIYLDPLHSGAAHSCSPQQ